MIATTSMAVWWLAGTQPGDNTGGQGPDFGKASPVALLVVVLLLIAVGFLVKSMTKHLRRVPTSFDPEDAGDTGTAGTDEAEAPPGEQGTGRTVETGATPGKDGTAEG